MSNACFGVLPYALVNLCHFNLLECFSAVACCEEVEDNL